MVLNELQGLVDKFILKTEEGYWDPLAMLAALVEEVGESARIINAIEGKKPLKIKESSSNRDLLKEELGDLLFALCCIANHYHIQLDISLKNTILKYQSRVKK